MPPSCALLGGFAIGARDVLLWQHYGNAWQSPVVTCQAQRTPHTLRTHARISDKINAPAACATLSATSSSISSILCWCCNANAKCQRVHACTRSMPSYCRQRGMWPVNIRSKNSPVLNWWCWLTQDDLCNGHKMLVCARSNNSFYFTVQITINKVTNTWWINKLMQEFAMQCHSMTGNWTTHGLDNSRTEHLVDWSTRGLDKQQTRQLADAAVSIICSFRFNYVIMRT